MRDDVTVCIPTFRGREEMCKRAVASAERQAQVVVFDDGDRPQDHCQLAWWEAIYLANTPFVGLLFDDDWYEPGFIDAAMRWMVNGIPYSFTDATIKGLEGGDRLNLNLAQTFAGDGHVSVADMEIAMSTMTLTISPSCAVFRRDVALRCLLPGGSPLSPGRKTMVGADLSMFLLPLLTHSHVGISRAPLVNFEAHAGSATTRAMETEDGKADLAAGYRDMRDVYMRMRR
jgi:hypothetical protein